METASIGGSFCMLGLTLPTGSRNKEFNHEVRSMWFIGKLELQPDLNVGILITYKRDKNNNLI